MSSQGFVIARVYTSDAYLPLRNAPVTFTQVLPDQSEKLLAVRLTDQSGLTSPILIDTPDLSQSLTPGASLPPYAIIRIRVEYPGYSSLLVEGVQVFPGVETVQSLQLRPLSMAQFQSDTPTIYHPSHQNL